MNEEPLDWFRREICGKRRHDHGSDGLRECLLRTVAELEAALRAAP